MEAGDIVAIRHQTPNWGYNVNLTAETAPKLFRVNSISERVRGGAIALQFSCVEYASEVYTEDSMIIEVDPAPNSNYRKSNTPVSLGTVAATDSSASINGSPISSLLVSWDGTDAFFNRVELRYLIGTSVPANPTWMNVSPGYGDNVTLTNLQPSTSYQVQYRAVSDVGTKADFVTITGVTSSLSAISGLNALGQWPSSGAVTVSQGDYYASSPSSGTNESLWFSISSSDFTVSGPTPQLPKDQSSALWYELASVTGPSGDAYKTFEAYINSSTIPTLLPSGIAVDSSANMTFVTSNGFVVDGETTPAEGEDTYRITATWFNANSAGVWTEFVAFGNIAKTSGNTGAKGDDGDTGDTPGLPGLTPDST